MLPFDPLQITETGFSVPAGTTDRFASLYTPLDGNAMDLNSMIIQHSVFIGFLASEVEGLILLR